MVNGNEREIQSALIDSRSIPELPSVAGWKEKPIVENNESMVPLGPLSSYYDLHTEPIYIGGRKGSPYSYRELEGSLMTMFVRKEVAQQLKKAQSLLPEGMHLVVFDAYRTLEVQQSLYDNYFNVLKKLHPAWNNDQLSAETQKYVSLPSTDPTRPSPHNTGGSVDVAIFKLPDAIEKEVQKIDQKLIILGNTDRVETERLQIKRFTLIEKNKVILDFGTKFDHGGIKASADYYEKLAAERYLTPKERDALLNRRLLYKVMKAAGFEAYQEEWWHYNSKKTQMGAKTAGIDYAEYGAMQLSLEDKIHEMKIRQLRLEAENAYINDIGAQLGIQTFNPEIDLTQIAVKEFGRSIRTTTATPAEKIEPVNN